MPRGAFAVANSSRPNQKQRASLRGPLSVPKAGLIPKAGGAHSRWRTGREIRPAGCGSLRQDFAAGRLCGTGRQCKDAKVRQLPALAALSLRSWRAETTKIDDATESAAIMNMMLCRTSRASQLLRNGGLHDGQQFEQQPGRLFGRHRGQRAQCDLARDRQLQCWPELPA